MVQLTQAHNHGNILYIWLCTMQAEGVNTHLWLRVETQTKRNAEGRLSSAVVRNAN